MEELSICCVAFRCFAYTGTIIHPYYILTVAHCKSAASLSLFSTRFVWGSASVRFMRSCPNRDRVSASAAHSPESCASDRRHNMLDNRFRHRVKALPGIRRTHPASHCLDYFRFQLARRVRPVIVPSHTRRASRLRSHHQPRQFPGGLDPELAPSEAPRTMGNPAVDSAEREGGGHCVATVTLGP